MTGAEQQPLGSGFDAASDAANVMAGVDLTGQVAVVTGGSSGLGRETVRALAHAGARVLAPVRRPGSLREETSFGQVEEISGFDLADLEDVSRAAQRIAELAGHGIDLVIAAAGVMATPLQRVGPGWEYQFTVNHLGHFVLLTRLYPLLTRRGARVVTYSSSAHHASGIRWGDLHFLSSYDKWKAYGQSKTATALLAVHLDALGHDDGVRAFAVHPGKILTRLQRDIPQEEQAAMGWVDEAGNFIGTGFKTPSQGAATGLWAGTTSDLSGRGGLFLEDCDIAPIVESGGAMISGVEHYAIDHEDAARMWRLSAAISASDIPR